MSNIIYAMQARNFLRKGCEAFFFSLVLDSKRGHVNLEDIPVIKEFPDVFPKELQGLPNGIKRTTCSPDHKNSHLFWLKGSRTFQWRRVEAILGVPISPSFEVLLDQVMEGKKEEKENKKMKVKLKSFKRINVTLQIIS